MQLDLRTVAITPKRNTFTHVARRIGGDKPASRYQEATFDLQMVMNFHYRPLWAPRFEIFDTGRTALRMADWNVFLDPRQYYYGSYALARARMQEAAEADFALVESRSLAEAIDPSHRQRIVDLFVPLRHVEWGGNTSNIYMSAYGYGAAITTPCLFHAMDRLGNAQYLTRIGLLLGGTDALDEGKRNWIEDEAWQPLRKLVEDMFVMEDWFELLLMQNMLLDGMLFPLFYEAIAGQFSARGAGAVLSMLFRFPVEWFAETQRWVNATIKIAATESPENRALLEQWSRTHMPAILSALQPLAERQFGAGAAGILGGLEAGLNARLTKASLDMGRA